MTTDNFTIRDLADGSGFAAIFDDHPDAAHLIYYDVIEGLATREQTIELFRTHGGNRAYAIPVSFLEFAPEVEPGADLPTTPGSLVRHDGETYVRIGTWDLEGNRQSRAWCPTSEPVLPHKRTSQLAGAKVIFDAGADDYVTSAEPPLAEWEQELLNPPIAPAEPAPTRPYNALRVRDDGKLDDLEGAEPGFYLDVDEDLWVVSSSDGAAELVAVGYDRARKPIRKSVTVEGSSPFTRVEIPEGTK